MNNLKKRTCKFLKDDKTKSIFAFLFFVWIVVNLTDLPNKMPIPVKEIWFYLNIAGIGFYSKLWVDNNFNRLEAVRGNVKKLIKKEAKKIGKEILLFIPIEVIVGVITYSIMEGEPQNQIGVEQYFWRDPITFAFSAIFIAPLIEEVTFRFLPRCFIKNGIIYVIFATVTFAAMHVIEDSNWFYYIWFYTVRPLWYSYRYYKTKDICIPIALHSFNNVFAIALILFK